MQFPYATTEGPLRDSHFPSYLSRSRKVSVVREELFNKGYLTVNGFTRIDGRRLDQRLTQDFPDYTATELNGLAAALKASRKLNSAGYVEVYEAGTGSWEKSARLIPEDAMSQRSFGLAVAVHDDQALVCDFKDGMYAFERAQGNWQQQNRIEVRCNTLAMSGTWAAIGSRQSVLVYHYNKGVWQKVQTLQPDNYLEEMDKGHNFEYFGRAIAVLDQTMFVGNPHGGDRRQGLVYVYKLVEGQWTQTDKLESAQKQSAFGEAISASPGLVFVGNTSAGAMDSENWQSGSVSMFSRRASGWQLERVLVPEGRPRYARFGLRVAHRMDPDGLQVLVRSSENVFRYEAPAPD